MTDKDRGESNAEQAQETGRFGAPSPIPNDAFTLQGQGPETAQLEREIGDKLRAEQRAASQDDTSTSSKPSKSSKSTSTSSSGSSSSSSSKSSS